MREYLEKYGVQPKLRFGENRVRVADSGLYLSASL